MKCQWAYPAPRAHSLMDVWWPCGQIKSKILKIISAIRYQFYKLQIDISLVFVMFTDPRETVLMYTSKHIPHPVYLLKLKFLRNNPFKPVYLIKNAEPVASWSDDKPNLRDWRQLNWFALSLMTSLPGFEVRKMLDQICGIEKRLLVIDVKFCRVNVDNHSCKILIGICYTILYYTKLSTFHIIV